MFKFLMSPFITLYALYLSVLCYFYDSNKYSVSFYIDTDNKIKFILNGMVIETNLKPSIPGTGIAIKSVSYSTIIEDCNNVIVYDEDDVQ